MSEREPLLPITASKLAELEAATKAYEGAVSEDAAFMLEMRGIGAHERRTFRLGVVADPFPGHEKVAGFLAIPYLDAEGRPLQIRFRCATDGCDHKSRGHGKYMSLAGDQPRMFNIGAIFRADEELHITEGELDAVILNKVGLHAVAIPGAQSWQSYHRRMVAGFTKVHVWGDPDEAGGKFSSTITRAVRNAQAVRLRKADGDVSDLYLSGGAEAIYARLRGEV